MPELNTEKKITRCYGRAPIISMQDGYAFDLHGECLGRCNEQGELLKDVNASNKQSAEDRAQEALKAKKAQDDADAKAKAEQEAEQKAARQTQAKAEAAAKKKAGEDLVKVKAELDGLGVSYHPNTGLEKLQAKLAEAKAAPSNEE